MIEITQEIIDNFRVFVPAFRDKNKWSDIGIQFRMEEADSDTGGAIWGEFRLDNNRNAKKRAMFYLTAHYLVSYYGVAGDVLDQTAVTPEARLNVSSQQVGDESLTYRITEMEPTVTDFISTTIYGTMYMAVRKQVCVGAFAV